MKGLILNEYNSNRWRNVQRRTTGLCGSCYKNNPNYNITDLEITIDGDFVNLRYDKKPIPFVRLRRITGYLTTTLDKWNDAKRAEEKDRVKHNT